LKRRKRKKIEILEKKPENEPKKEETDNSVEIAMENLLEKLNLVKISENNQNTQPGTMPPVFDIGDETTFRKFINSEFSRWTRFERIPENEKSCYLSAVFNDNDLAEKVDKIVEREDGEILDISFDEIIEKIEDLIREKRGGWQVVDSVKSTPRTSIVTENLDENKENNDKNDILENKVKEFKKQQEKLISSQLSSTVDQLSKLPSLPEKIEADSKSVYVGQVDYSCSAYEV